MRAELEGKGVSFLAFSIDQDVERNRAYAKRYEIRMRIATTSGIVLAPLGLSTVPATLFIDRRGTIVEVANGSRSEGFFRRRIQALIDR